MFSPTTDGVNRSVLDNGLKVLVKENHAAPVAAVVAYVGIGYFNEPDRLSGITHVIEHMLFKGTARRPAKEQIAQDVRALGGTLNAGTGYEETAYYIILPSEHLDAAVEIQADMLQNSLFDADELAKELEVIIQESKQKRDNPGAMLVETMYARAFDHHRIRRWRIGEDEPLRNLGRLDLVRFVEQTYRPENITIAIVGDVQADRAFDSVDRYWGSAPRGELHKEQSPDEREREEFRFHRMYGPIQQRLFVFGFHSPTLFHEDTPALSVLSGLLGDGRSSRLFRSLKEERGLVNTVWAEQDGLQDIGVFTLGAETANPDPLPSEFGLFQELRKIIESEVGADELQLVKTRIESRRLFAQEEVLGVARTLAWYEAAGDYRLWDEMIRRLRAVSESDVRRVAAEYLRPGRATLVEYLPSMEERSAASTERILLTLEDALPNPRPSKPRVILPDEGTEILRLSSGESVVFKRRADLPIVAIHVIFPGGRHAETPEIAGITNLMLKSLLKGTKSWSASEIAERIEGLGSGIGLSLSPDYFGFSMKILSSRLEEGMEVLREVISKPAFESDEIEKEKQSIYAEIRRQRDSMFSRAMELFNRASFGDQPYGLPGSGIAESIERLTDEALRGWHGRWVRSGNAIIAAVGDVEAGFLASLFEDAIPAGSLSVSEESPNKFLIPSESVDSVERHQTASVMGFRGADANNDDRHALDILAEITSGLAGRFFQAVRGENALAYTVTSFHRARKDAGFFGTYTATSPENELKAREILLSECERLAREPVDEKELADAKQALRGEQVVHTQTFSSQAGEMASHRIYGRPLDETERYLARIATVTRDELRSVAAKYLRPDAVWLGIVRGQGT